jgi:hypothetical protein
MPSTVEFPFSDDEALPTIPITLSYSDFSVSANALLDTGSTVNLLPYDIGLQLDASWEKQTIRTDLFCYETYAFVLCHRSVCKRLLGFQPSAVLFN